MVSTGMMDSIGGMLNLIGKMPKTQKKCNGFNPSDFCELSTL